MIAVDTNVLVYAHREDADFHEIAFFRINHLAEGKGLRAIPWPCVHEFLAIVTHPRIYSPPTPLELALDQVAARKEWPNLILLGELEGYLSWLKTLLDAGKVTGAMVHDARIEALCLLYGITELWASDRDFFRFSDLNVRNPLVG